MDIGTYDIPILIQLVNNFIPVLQSKGYTYQYRVYHEGHSWGNWRAHIDNALLMFFPGSATSLKAHFDFPKKFELYQNYPNPFNPTTTIKFSLPVFGEVTLTIYNTLGEEVTILFSAPLPSGSHSVKWDASDLASGVYLYKLEAGEYVETRKMVLIK
jgi:enterochelin esterase family protein